MPVLAICNSFLTHGAEEWENGMLPSSAFLLFINIYFVIYYYYCFCFCIDKLTMSNSSKNWWDWFWKSTSRSFFFLKKEKFLEFIKIFLAPSTILKLLIYWNMTISPIFMKRWYFRLIFHSYPPISQKVPITIIIHENSCKHSGLNEKREKIENVRDNYL